MSSTEELLKVLAEQNQALLQHLPKQSAKQRFKFLDQFWKFNTDSVSKVLEQKSGFVYQDAIKMPTFRGTANEEFDSVLEKFNRIARIQNLGMIEKRIC